MAAPTPPHLAPCLYRGTVAHARWSPLHAFTYPAAMLWVDVDGVCPSSPFPTWWWPLAGVNTRSLVSFDDRAHFPDRPLGESLGSAVRASVAAALRAR